MLHISAEGIIKSLHRFKEPVKLKHSQHDVPEKKAILGIMVGDLKNQLVKVPIELVSDVKHVLLPEKASQEAQRIKQPFAEKLEVLWVLVQGGE